jgi:hypothetical protein
VRSKIFLGVAVSEALHLERVSSTHGIACLWSLDTREVGSAPREGRSLYGCFCPCRLDTLERSARYMRVHIPVGLHLVMVGSVPAAVGLVPGSVCPCQFRP